MAVKGKITEVPLAKATPSDLLSVDEVAELCGMTPGRVCQLLRSGEMSGVKFRGIVWQVQRREAAKFLDKPVGRGRPRSGRQ